MAKGKQSSFIVSQLLAQHGIHGFFSLRQGGMSSAPYDSLNLGFGLGDAESNVTANLDTFMQLIHLPNTPHQAIQTHQTDHLWCSGEGYMHEKQADILLSNQTHTALAVRTADCLPILLADPKAGITAAVHAGWKGTASKVVQKAVESMLKRGAAAEHILVSLGPCIDFCCFNIEEDIATALQQSTKEASKHVGKTANLRQINRLQLLELNINAHHIECINACTACDSTRFFSFRRDAGTTGRHLAVVAIASKP